MPGSTLDPLQALRRLTLAVRHDTLAAMRILLIIRWVVLSLATALVACGGGGGGGSSTGVSAQPQAGDGQAEAHWREQAEEIERLRAIVEKLPQTADGMPVVPGMKVYQEDPSGCLQSYDVGGNSARTDDSIPTAAYLVFNHRCYSSLEAAEAAREKP